MPKITIIMEYLNIILFMIKYLNTRLQGAIFESYRVCKLPDIHLYL